MTIMLKRILFLAVATLLALVAEAQTKRWEHNFYVGMGFSSTAYDGDISNTSLRAGYGLNYYLTDKWSLMPGVAFRGKGPWGDTNYKENGYASDVDYLDVPVLAQYHARGQKRHGFVVECGPVFSFLLDGGHYFRILGNPDELQGKHVYKSFDIGIQPAIYYQVSHWRFGVQAHLGCLNVRRQYLGHDIDSYHNSDVSFIAGFHF